MKIEPLVISPFHKDMFACINTARSSSVTMLDKMRKLLTGKYGDTAPTWEQFKADRAALKSLADDKGLTDDQWVRKPYNVAVKALYGELPASQSAAALAKRKTRGPKSGAVKGQTAPRTASERETLEQYVARVGVFKVLEVCAKILEADTSTKEVAGHIRELKAA